MALDDVQHVEAVAIMRRLADTAAYAMPRDPEAVEAAEKWLKANHPEPGAYMAAMASMVREEAS